MKKLTALLIIFVAIIFSSDFCIDGVKSFAAPKADVIIKLIETSDVHGALFPFDFVENTATDNSLAQVYSYVYQERKVRNQQVVLLDSGDILHGTPVVYYYNYEAPKSKHICAEIMNYMKYDAFVPGHHDFEPGHKISDRVAEESDFPWICANAVKVRKTKDEDKIEEDKQKGIPYFKPYVVLDKKGVKIAVLGLTTPRIETLLPKKRYEKVRFLDIYETAQKWVKKIKTDENPDIMVVQVYAGKNDSEAEAAKAIAEKVPGVDVVFTAYKDDNIVNKVSNVDGRDSYMMYHRPGARGISTMTFEMDYDRKEKKWSILNKTAEVLNVKELVPSPIYLKKFKKQQDLVKKFLSRSIGSFAQTVSAKDAQFGDSAFTAISHKVQLALSKADISFAAPLSFDKEIKKGKVSANDLFKLYKFENLLYSMMLTGEEIKKYLEYSYSGWFRRMAGPDDFLYNFKLDGENKLMWTWKYHNYETDTKYWDHDSAAGIDYEVDVSKPAGQRVTIHGFSKMGRPQDSKTFDPKAEYKVAVNSYRANGGGGHLTSGCGIMKPELPKRILYVYFNDIRYAIMQWIQSEKKIKPEPMGNWKLLPEKWVKQAKEREMKLLFDPEPPESAKKNNWKKKK